jgi:hypothetical protein
MIEPYESKGAKILLPLKPELFRKRRKKDFVNQANRQSEIIKESESMGAVPVTIKQPIVKLSVSYESTMKKQMEMFNPTRHSRQHKMTSEVYPDDMVRSKNNFRSAKKPNQTLSQRLRVGLDKS